MSGGATGGRARAGSSGGGVAGGVDTGAATARLPNGGAGILGRLYAGTLPVHPHTDELTGGEIDYLRTSWGADHLADADPHSQYLTTADGNLLYQPLGAAPDLEDYYTKSEADSAFLSESEADALYLPLDYVPPASGISQADADTRYVNTAGDTMSGGLQVNGAIVGGSSLYVAGGVTLELFAIAPNFYADAGAATTRGFHLRTSGSLRWFVGSLPSAETGSNAGSDYVFNRYSDAAALLGTALSLSRATGAATFGGTVTVNPPAGSPALTTGPAVGQHDLVGGRGYVSLGGTGTSTNMVVNLTGAAVHPSPTGSLSLGTSGVRWNAIFAAAADLTTYVKLGGTAAAAGAVRLPNGTTGNLAWRNAGNTADLTLGVDASNALVFNGSPLGGGGAGLPTTGGTMTGTIVADGADVVSGGALRVHGSGASATDANLHGAGSPAYAPAVQSVGVIEAGITFTPTGAQYLCAVRWYRITAGQTRPATVRLWDSTSTASPVWSTTTLTDWADTALGWKTQRLPAGTQPLLVAGRAYVLTYTTITGGNTTYGSAYTPVPAAGFTFGGHKTGTTATYPTSATGISYGIDGGFRTTLATPDPAESGAVRLPNDLPGKLAWRNGADGADLSLTMDASDRLALAVGADALTTSATAGGATALPATPATYITIVCNGTAYKVPGFAV